MTSMMLGVLHAVRAVPGDTVTILSLDPEHGPVGTSVNVTGQTLTNTMIDLCYLRTALDQPTAPCDSSTLIASATSNATGYWACPSSSCTPARLQIPASVAGRHPLLAVEHLNSNIEATRAFTVNPLISVSPTSGAVDDSLQISGTGFAGSSGVIVNYDTRAIQGCVSIPSNLSPVSTDGFGSFSARCTVPESAFTVPDGRHEIEAVDQSGNKDSMNFHLVASVSITPTSGPVGIDVNTDRGTTLTRPDPAVTVTVKARGFVQQAPVTVCFNRSGPFQDCSHTGNSSALGSFSFQFPMPQIPAGQYIFDANQTVGSFTMHGIRNATFSVVTDLDLNPDHARFGPGRPVEVEATGTGFAALSPLTVTLRRLPTVNPGARPCSGAVVLTLVSGRTLSTGSFFLNFSTPSVNTGLYQVDGMDAQGNDACADFAIGAFLRIKFATPTEGKVGDTITIQGYGFTASSSVNVQMASNETAPTRYCDSITRTFRTDSNGDFGTTTSNGSPAQFTVPNCNHGDYNIVATDSHGLPGTAGPYRVFPWIDITPKTRTEGSTIAVTGTGFASGVSVDILYFGANAPMDQLAPRTPVGFEASNSRTIWSGTIPQNLTAFSGGMALSDLTNIWQIETVGGENSVGTPTSGQFGNFATSFPVPESWGGYHPVYGRERVSGVSCGPDGTGPVVRVAVLCGQAFRNQPTVTITPSDPKAGETLTLTGTGFMSWEHYSTQTVSSVCGQEQRVLQTGLCNNVYRLVFDIGRSTGYIDEARHILNGQRDASWDAGFYLPVALNQMGTIVYWDFNFDHIGFTTGAGTLGQVGSPFVKAPSLQPGDYNFVAYRLKLGSLPTADQSEKATRIITVKSAELDAVTTARTDILSRIGQAQDAIIREVHAARDAILSIANAIKTSTDQIPGVRDTVNTVKSTTDTIKTSTDLIPGVRDTTNAVKSTTDSIKTTTDNLTTTTNAIKSNTDQVPTVKTTTDTVKSTTDSIKSDTSNLTTSLPLVLQTPLGYIITILAAIAALGAVASALLVSRRLKVVK